LVSLREYGDPAEVRLGLEQARALGGAGLVDVVATGEPGSWLLVPSGRVGAVACGDVNVRVDPKVTIDRIVFMLGYTLRGISWRDATVDVEEHAEIVHVLAEVFARAVASALKPGMLQGYQTVEEALPVVRGRIRIDEQMKRRPGMLLPIEVTYDDFTVDIAENQILGAAITALLRNPHVDPVVRRRLSALALQFADVSRLTARAALPHWRRTRLNQRYEIPLRLAELILAGSSFEHRVGGLRVEGFVLDMPRIFEDFVTCALRDALQPLHPGSAVIGQFATWLDEDELIALRPDVVWLDEQERPLAVLDAKYKAEKPAGFPNADIYQALAYAMTLGLEEAHLIYAKGNEMVQTYTARSTGVRINAHALDLARSPDDLLDQIADLALTVSPHENIRSS
jgi:5-methylcytosine-specific restriction enzyme subunit McrC